MSLLILTRRPCFVRAKLHIKNLSHYFVAIPTAQIVRTVGLVFLSWSLVLSTKTHKHTSGAFGGLRYPLGFMWHAIQYFTDMLEITMYVRHYVMCFLQGKELTSNHISGALCIAQPWPGMARTIHNDHQRFTETYCQPYPGTKRSKINVLKIHCLGCFSGNLSLCQQVTSLRGMAPIALWRGITRSPDALMMSSTWAVIGLGQRR